MFLVLFFVFYTAAVIYDKITKRSKSFGFVTYATKEAADRALGEPIKLIDGYQAEV